MNVARVTNLLDVNMALFSAKGVAHAFCYVELVLREFLAYSYQPTGHPSF